MKNKLIILVIGLLFSVGCTDDFLEMNTNPLTIGFDKTPENMLFTNALKRGVLDYATYQRGEFLYANLICQYWANAVSGWATDRYNMNDSWIQAYWDDYFCGFGMDAYMCQLKLEESEKNINKTSMVRIWRVWMLHRMTDYFGPLPNSEAFKANDGILKPKYDSQKEIYEFMLKELKEAVESFNPDQKASFGSADILFNGNIESWVKFSNALRMRLAMRISDVEPELAKQNFVEAYNAGALQSNDDNVLMKCYNGTYLEKNPLSTILSFANERRISKTMVDYLNENSDPRKAKIARYPYKGLPNGMTDAQLGTIVHTDYSKAGTKYWRGDYPTEILKYSEVCLLLAEAAHKGWVTDKPARQYYEDGIKASMQFHQASLGSYLSKPNVEWNEEKAMEQIHLQKWIALFPNGMEAFAEIRRTGYPKMNSLMAPPNQTSTQGSYPCRIAYPSSEVSWNEDNAQPAMDAAGFSGNNMTSKLWWDIEANN
uniref:SusD/RagB family nutrient-binding outer membrane lipoprotein n=1 Tax=uncultured Draconibacterium sp. TaxID=1573823 RepID=UPI0032165780